MGRDGRRRTGGLRLALGMTAVVTVTAVLAGAAGTQASIEDWSAVNLAGSGFHTASSYDIALVDLADPATVVRQADTGDGIDLVVDTPDGFVPGKSFTTTVRVFNNTKAVDGEVSMSLAALDNGTAGAVWDPSGELLVSAVEVTGGVRTLLVGTDGDPFAGAALSTVSGPVLLGGLAARGGARLGEGDAWLDGAPGSYRDVELTIAFPADSAEARLHRSGTSRTQVTFSSLPTP